ncbi:MAG: phage tail spike protein [Dorea sp.]
MERVRIAILDNYDNVVAFMDNGAPKAMHYYDDELHEYLKGTANTFTFTASAKHEDSEYLIEGNKIAFVYRDKDYYLNIMNVRRDELEVEVTAFSLSFELLNEEKEEYAASEAKTFEEYLNVFDYEKVLTLGNNEVSDKSIKHEWTGTDTLLARIFTLATAFSAEAEFVVELNDNYSLKRIVLNVYKEHSDTVQGIGTKRTDIALRYGKNVTGIIKTSDITDLYTAIRPIGRDGLTITSLDKSEYDADGNLEYSSPSGNRNILAVQARDRFPSNLMSNANDRYIAKIWNYDTDNVNVLYGQALAELKKNCVPQVEYEVKGYFDTDIGDTVTIEDEEYNPKLYLEARVTEQVRSFTDQSRNQTTFDNFKELQSHLDPALVAKMNASIEQNKTYTCMISTDNGTTLKNNEGETTLTASVSDGIKDVTDSFTIVWKKDGADLSTGKSITVNAEDVDGKALYRFEAQDADGNVKGFYEVTITDVNDGKDGLDGKDGSDGADGKDGVSSYTHIKYSDDGETFTGIGNLASQNRDDWVAGYYSSATTVDTEEPDKLTTSYTRICMKTAFRVIPGKTYKLNTGYTADNTAVRMGYTAYLSDGSCKTAVLPNYNNVSYKIPDDVTHVRIYMYSSSAASLDTWTEWFESGTVAPIFGEPNELLGSYPGAWMGTLVDNNEVASLTFSDYTWKKIEGEPGNDGKDGQPTGIVESDEEPSEKYIGMLWKNTGTTAGLVQGATYRWNGTSWDMYTFRAENIEAESFKGYEFNGSIFKSEFVDEASPYLRYIGEMIQQNGRIKIESKMQTKTDSAEEWIDRSTRKVQLDYDGLGFSETERETETTKNANLTLENLALLLDLLEDIPKIKCGTKVLTATGGTSIKVFTIDELNTLFGVEDCSATNTACFFANGDGNAQSVHIDGATYLNSAWNAVFNDKSTAGNFRVNYMAIYFG